MNKIFVLLFAVVLAGCSGGLKQFADTSSVDDAGLSLVENSSSTADTPTVARKPWFASFRSGPAEIEVATNTGPLTFGLVAKVCKVSKRDLGDEVQDLGGFTLYDTNVGSLAPRTHYITGFRDRCARKFTAGMAFFGEPDVHETQRYRSRADFTPADDAYEVLKAKVCKVDEGRPCGARLEKLADTTVFVSIYKSFSAVRSAGELLLHKGRLQATDFES